MEERDVVIVGGGPAGLAAAVYCRRAGLKTVVLEKGNWGGAINRTEEIENYPAIAHTSGPEIGKMFVDHAKAFNAEMVDCTVNSIAEDGKFKVVSTSKGDYKAKVVIVATGAEFRKLGCPGGESRAIHGAGEGGRGLPRRVAGKLHARAERVGGGD